MSKNLLNIDITFLQLKNLKTNKIVIASMSNTAKKQSYYPFFFFRKKIDNTLVYFIIIIFVLLNFLSINFLLNNINLVLNFNTTTEIIPKFFFSRSQIYDFLLIHSVYSILTI